MIKTLLASASACFSFLAVADALTVEPKILEEQTPVKIVLTLETPADSAFLELKSYQLPFYLNQSNRILLSPSADRKTFAAEVTPETFYHQLYGAGKPNGAGAIEAIPVVTRGGKEERLKTVHPWTQIKMLSLPQKVNGVVGGLGKFGKGLCFVGEEAMAAVNQVPFNAEKGTIEAWVFLPLMLKKEGAIVWFIQRADGSRPWSYHQLTVPANSRKVQYLTYNGQPRNAVGWVLSKEITGEDWVHIAAVYDLAAGKMELFVNGESQGTAPYTVPCGGAKGDLNIGARIHNISLNTSKFIGGCQMQLDDLRISNTVRPGTVPAKALEKDEATLLLLGSDGGDYIRKAR